MEGFCEQVVKVKKGVRHLIYILLLLVVFIVPVAFFVMGQIVTGDYFYGLFGLVLSMLAVLVWWIVFPRILNTQLDYAVVGNKFHIDKVSANSSRKKKLRVEIKNIEKLEKVDENTNPDKKYENKYDFTGGHDMSEVYFAEFRIPDKGLCMMLFCPNEKILNGMRPMLRREIVQKLFLKK